jgi:hypothetical protein
LDPFVGRIQQDRDSARQDEVPLFVGGERPSARVSSLTWPLICAARAPAGLERGGDRSAGPAGGRAARGERSEPP